MPAAELYIGLMSGTSLDGIDAALVDFSGPQPSCIATAYQPYPDDLRRELLALHRSSTDELHHAALLANRLAHLYEQAVERVLANAGGPAVLAIGCHGQTVRHMPGDGYTLQLNNPALLAELSGLTVVADFRSRDIAAGGQGAPLVPAFHDAAFRTPDRHRTIVNIGGIANISDLRPGAPVRGLDCGPGNMLMDAWAQRHLGRPYDANGEWASQGHVLPDLLQQLLAHEFFALPPPKSCGREQFNLDWLMKKVGASDTAIDVQATLTELTARGIADAVSAWCGRPDELWLCGGGAHNACLVRALRNHLGEVPIAKTDSLGLPADWVEAVAFAWLARQTMRGEPGNLPEVTGARGRRVLGAIYPA